MDYWITAKQKSGVAFFGFAMFLVEDEA